MKLGILGGGQLGMMMCQEAKDLKISTFIFTDAEDSPATKFSDEHIIPNMMILKNSKDLSWLVMLLHTNLKIFHTKL